MDLLCVRHGRTEWNARKRFQGHTDIPLDDEGRAQAQALAALLRDEPIATAAASDLLRAAETARIVLGARDVPLRLDPDWREMRFGAWEGLTWDEIVSLTPELDPGSDASPKTYTPQGGESFEQLAERVRGALQRVVAETPAGATALVATHAGPLHALLRVLLGEQSAEALKVRFVPASLTRFRHEDGGWRLVRLNQTAPPVAR
ncbi:MAG TPA: histidine phosphatase family protein [Candidatus Baltobacteraceae bacterium]|nr:histidine phosphatase family protein [Candidatus Baltobacteraceae bacterium]